MKRATIGFLCLAFGALSCSAAGAASGGLGGGGGLSAGGLGGGGLANVASGCGNFGASASAKKLEAFLQASAAFTSTADELQHSLLDACTRMGTALGVPAGEMQASAGARAVCDRVSHQLHDEMTAVRGAHGVHVAVVTRPPVCEVAVDAYAQCAGQCDASVDPGHAEVHCEGGEMRGTCSGNCSGRCAADVHGQCGGRCEGTCSGGCTGVCHGTCSGTCRTRGTDGQCNGACQGTCQGSCSAGCTGGCEGSCEVSGQASCSGECRGGCSVQMTNPRCTGRVEPPHMSADCRASCDARLNAQATCRPAEVHVAITGTLTGDLQARADHLRAALEAGYGTILGIHEKLERLKNSAEAMVNTGRELPGAIGELGVSAATCLTQATAALPGAVSNVNVSFEVSVSVSASASASAG